MSDRLNRPRVCLVTGADLRRAAPGGTRTYVLGLASFLVKSGFAVEISSNGPVDGAQPECRITRIMEEHVPSSRRFHRGLARWASNGEFGAIGLLHFQRPDDLWPLRHVPLLPPAVCTLHGDPLRAIRRRHGFGLAAAYRYIESATISRFVAIVSVDDETAEIYRSRYPFMAAKISVVPNAVDEEFFRQDKGLPGEIALGSPTFIYAGRLSREKRVDAIIRAVSSGQAPLGSVLLIAGSGPEEARLQRLANGSRIRFLGNREHSSMVELYQRAAALILASEYEGRPTVALEALASGCPVIAPAGCGLDALLEEGRGILMGDLSELPEAMARATEIRRNPSRSPSLESLSWSTTGKRLIEVYRSVASDVIP